VLVGQVQGQGFYKVEAVLADRGRVVVTQRVDQAVRRLYHKKNSVHV